MDIFRILPTFADTNQYFLKFQNHNNVFISSFFNSLYHSPPSRADRLAIARTETEETAASEAHLAAKAGNVAILVRAPALPPRASFRWG